MKSAPVVSLLLFGVLASNISIGPSAADAADRPNIVFFFADDQTISTIGCYGNDVIKTPNKIFLALRFFNDLSSLFRNTANKDFFRIQRSEWHRVRGGVCFPCILSLYISLVCKYQKTTKKKTTKALNWMDQIEDYSKITNNT